MKNMLFNIIAWISLVGIAIVFAISTIGMLLGYNNVHEMFYEMFYE